MPVISAKGASFFKNELLWAVYPPYTNSSHDVLEVLDYDLLCENTSEPKPSCSPLKHSEVLQLVDAHDFGGLTTTPNQK
jgi:hypothetical protein